MKSTSIQRALIAVYDKSSIAPFVGTLVSEFGVEILSTGGTARHLSEAGLPVTLVESVTGFPEMLDGRVKTLHPMVHGGILADRSKPAHRQQLTDHDIRPIDMVVVSLYPFRQTIARPDCTFDEAIEMIDIGGPCMLRAAAKNHQHVVVVPDPSWFETILGELREHGDVLPSTRTKLAAATFAITHEYDQQITGYLRRQAPADSTTTAESPAHEGQPPAGPWTHDRLGLNLDRTAALRYGENPHQAAAVFVPDHTAAPREASLLTGRELTDKAMSFNNQMDGNAALELVKDLTRVAIEPYAVAFIKHMNPCGLAVAADPQEAYTRAYLGDPIAAAGGVLCMNFPVTRDLAEMVMTTFARWGKKAGAAFFKLDVWIAPSFEPDAVELITTPTEKRKWGSLCRLLAVGPMDTPPDPQQPDIKQVTGGVLIQQRDLVSLNEDAWNVATETAPGADQWRDLRFAWLAAKYTKSNAIVIARDGQLLGAGAGQMSRVKSCDLAIQLARENGHGDKLDGAVAAGDAFFPVSDGPQKLIDAGVKAIIHPGGSQRDAESIDLCNRHQVAMVITGTRHFRH